jgi:hypothetical protein
MEKKKLLAGWHKICPACNIGRKYPDSFIGKKVRNHWEKGCPPQIKRKVWGFALRATTPQAGFKGSRLIR